MTALKPCPFCGSEVKKVKNPLTRTILFVCKKCGADVCFFGSEKGDKANKAWNKRVTIDYDGFDECK